jgi:hypothetical protein
VKIAVISFASCVQIANRLWANQSGFLKQFQPELGFVRLYNHNTDLRDELFPRSRAACCTVVCRDRCSASDELSSYGSHVVLLRQYPAKSHDSQRELLGSIPEFLLWGEHFRGC